jgi:hypothetical protein
MKNQKTITMPVYDLDGYKVTKEELEKGYKFSQRAGNHYNYESEYYAWSNFDQIYEEQQRLRQERVNRRKAGYFF